MMENDLIMGNGFNNMILQMDMNNTVVERYSTAEVAASWMDMTIDEMRYYIHSGEWYEDFDGEKYKFVVEWY